MSDPTRQTAMIKGLINQFSIENDVVPGSDEGGFRTYEWTGRRYITIELYTDKPEDADLGALSYVWRSRNPVQVTIEAIE